MGHRYLEGGQPKKTMGNQKNKTGCPKGKLLRKKVSNTEYAVSFFLWEISNSTSNQLIMVHFLQFYFVSLN